MPSLTTDISMIVNEILSKGGPIVWILAGYSVIALTILLERFLRFLFMGRPGRNTEQNLLNAFRSGDIETFISPMRGPESRIMQGIYRAYNDGVNDLQQVAIRLGSAELYKMERGFRTLAFLGNTAPLLGLLGTILGMIKAFMIIEQAGGQVDASALAGGIWEAMLTTGVGLAVAIPILLLLHVLESSADRRAHSMRNYASLMLENLPHHHSAADRNAQSAARHRDGIVHAV
jgi:biopolymer transport protein ExbB